MRPTINCSAFVSIYMASLLSFLSGTVFGETIVAWDTFGAPGDQVTHPATTVAPNVAGNDIVRGGGLIRESGLHAFNSRGWATNAEFDPTVVNPTAFVEIGFTTDPGVSVTLDELIMGSRSSGSGPAIIGVFSSLDGFTTPFDTIDQASVPPGFFVNSVIDLGSLGSVSGEFLLRFMNIGGDLTADPARPGEMDELSTWRIGNHLDSNSGAFLDLQISGTVSVIPEPGTLGIFVALASACLVIRRRT